MYYGELRDRTTCITDRRLISSSVEFSEQFVNASFNVTGCAWTTTKYEPGVTRHSFARCENAVLQCATSLKMRSGRKRRLCRGVVHVDNNMSFVCELGDASEGWNPSSPCLLAHNLAFKSEFWLNGLDIGFDVVSDVLAATYGAGSEVRTVKFQNIQYLTKITPLWFAAFAFKIAVVFGLLCWSFVLLTKGYYCRVHDEYQLSILLRENLAQISLAGEDSVYLNAIKVDGYVAVWASAHSGNQSRDMKDALHY